MKPLYGLTAFVLACLLIATLTAVQDTLDTVRAIDARLAKADSLASVCRGATFALTAGRHIDRTTLTTYRRGIDACEETP